MKATEAVKKIMTEQSVTKTAMAGRLGISFSALSERLTQENISVKKLLEMLRVLDYKIVIVPRSSRLQEGGIEIE